MLARNLFLTLLDLYILDVGKCACCWAMFSTRDILHCLFVLSKLNKKCVLLLRKSSNYVCKAFYFTCSTIFFYGYQDKEVLIIPPTEGPVDQRVWVDLMGNEYNRQRVATIKGFHHLGDKCTISFKLDEDEDEDDDEDHKMYGDDLINFGNNIDGFRDFVREANEAFHYFCEHFLG